MTNMVGYVSSSSELALEYLKLGKSKRARKVLNQALPAARSNHASDNARALFFLSYAASCIADDDLEQRYNIFVHEVSPSQSILHAALKFIKKDGYF